MRGRGVRSDAPKAEHVAYVRDHASTTADQAIGKALGLSAAQVMWIRHRNGIPAMETFWTPARLETLKAMYILQGVTSEETAAALGCTSAGVRSKIAKLKWKRAPGARAANQFRAQRAIAVRKAAAPKPAPAPKAPKAAVSANDADLIADFLARKKVTVLPSGLASGLSAMESEFGMSVHPNSSWKDQQAAGLKRMKARAA